MSHHEPNQGASDEWYTPKYIFDALRCGFDLDVAAPADGPLHVPALTWFSEGALEKAWFGYVWMNPPFGGRGALKPWLDRFFSHGNGIALTPDRTSADWFQDTWERADLALFMPKVKFIRPDGSTGNQPSNGTCLWAAGDRGCEALRKAAPALGILAKPERRKAA